MTRTVNIQTLGCKVNQAESEALAEQFAQAGWLPVSADEPADVYVINTCAVTHVADRKSRQLVRRARRANPAARVVVTGCTAEPVTRATLQDLDVDLLVPNAQKPDLVALVAHSEEVCESVPAAGRARTRAMVKIQDGCDNFCTYCVVPLTRGRARSRPLEEVVAAVREREAQGVREVVLTGVDVSVWGREWGQGLSDLLRALLAGTTMPRLRLTSIEPDRVDPALFDLWSDARLCRHIHLPLQSGSDAVLARMGRRYTRTEYLALCRHIQRRVPGVALTTDVIVGFPGESDDDFETTAALCRTVAFARLHVFKYSRRPGTPAAEMPAQVEYPTKQRRAERLSRLGSRLQREFALRFVDTEMDVLWEEEDAVAAAELGVPVWTGLTGNYLRVYLPGAGDLRNRITTVRLVKPFGDGLLAARPDEGDEG